MVECRRLGPSNTAQICNTAAVIVSKNSYKCSENVRFTRRNTVGKECHDVITYFNSKQEETKSHCFARDLDSDGSFGA